VPVVWGTQPKPLAMDPQDSNFELPPACMDSENFRGEDLELIRMTSGELEEKANAFQKMVQQRSEACDDAPRESKSKKRELLVNNQFLDDNRHNKEHHHKTKKGAFAGVFVPTCENMWGVLIFLRFYTIVGHAGVGQALLCVFLSFSAAFCTTSSMSATISSGGLVSKGGPYYMISRALGPCVGASVGIMYWLAITMLCVLETLGAVEGILMAEPKAYFTWCRQVYGSVFLFSLAIFVYLGINFVTKLGIFFALIVFYTLWSYAFGLCTAPVTDTAKQIPWITGLSFDTLKDNWTSHYASNTNFGYCLSVFFPCFTGILSGANRADVLRDPPKNIRQGTFGAIIFSLFMYSAFMILWGMVANYQYLQEKDWFEHTRSNTPRRLAGGGEGGGRIVAEIVWNPFPLSANLGIIISSLSQALQCLVVAPRLLQSIAKDKILSVLDRLAPLSKKGEPARALAATYVVGGLLVLLGKVDLVAPLLSMCFLVAYAFMNFSCFALTWLKSPAWRPKGVQRKRWRFWYLGTGSLGFTICLTIMFTIDPLWALSALFISLCLYFYINYKLEARGWGSAMDGIRFQLALTSLIQIEGSQHHHVNWRPQVLILYRIRLAEELKGIKHHEILRFYSQLRKGNGFCVVACVLEAARDEHAMKKARIEKGIIQSIMKEESIQGFAEVVVAPSWVEGTNYIIQLTGIGGLSPNTVLLDWPQNWQEHLHKAIDFINILKTALAGEKAVLAVKGLRDVPFEEVHGTIDIWWIIHDGGFLILLSWLLVQHKVWRKCHLRVFTITEGVSEEHARAAAALLSKTLRQRRLFDVDVEVILADDEMITPYTWEWTLRLEDRRTFVQQLHKEKRVDVRQVEAVPLEIDDLFEMEKDIREARSGQTTPRQLHDEEKTLEDGGVVSVSDVRRFSTPSQAQGVWRTHPTLEERSAMHAKAALLMVEGGDLVAHRLRNMDVKEVSRYPHDANIPVPDNKDEEFITLKPSLPWKEWTSPPVQPQDIIMSPDEGGALLVSEKGPQGSAPEEGQSILSAMISPNLGPRDAKEGPPTRDSRKYPKTCPQNAESFAKLNQIIHQRSKRAQLVVMNLPDLWGDEPDDVRRFMGYCDDLTAGLDRVLFVHSSGHEIFDISV